MISGMAVLELQTTSVDLELLWDHPPSFEIHGSVQTLRQQLALED